MPWHPDHPRRVWLATFSLGAVPAIVAIVAWRALPTLAPVTEPSTNTTATSSDRSDSRTGPAPVRSERWQVALWRPFRDAPPASAPATRPSVRLVALIDRDGRQLALLDAQDGQGPFTLAPGEERQGIALVARDERSATISVAGTQTRLEIEP